MGLYLRLGVCWKKNSDTTDALLISVPIEYYGLAESPSLCVLASGSQVMYNTYNHTIISYI